MTKGLARIALIAFGLSGAACARHAAPLPPAPAHTNAAGVALIKEIEALRLKPYRLDGHWYVGYGHLMNSPGPAITEAEAERLLRVDLAMCEGAIRRTVTVPVNANEFSAMASLCYTIGAPGFTETSIVRRLNAGDRHGAADAFLLFTKAADEDGRKRTLDVLKTRRQKERALFLTPETVAAASS